MQTSLIDLTEFQRLAAAGAVEMKQDGDTRATVFRVHGNNTIQDWIWKDQPQPFSSTGYFVLYFEGN